MKVMISAVHTDYRRPPTLHIAAESEFNGSLEAVQEDLLAKMANEDALIVFTIFEVPDGTDEMAYTLMAANERDNERERMMAILYFHAAQSFMKLRDGGVYAPTDPVPMSAEDVQYVFAQLKRRPDYRNFRLLARSQDGTLVQ